MDKRNNKQETNSGEGTVICGPIRPTQPPLPDVDFVVLYTTLPNSLCHPHHCYGLVRSPNNKTRLHFSHSGSVDWHTHTH